MNAIFLVLTVACVFVLTYWLTAGIMNRHTFAGARGIAQYGPLFSTLNVVLSGVLLVCVAIILGISVRKWRELWPYADERQGNPSESPGAASPLAA